MNRILALLAFVSIVFTACNSNEIGNMKDVNPESIYFDYQVSGEEGNDFATVMLQYRFAGPHGTTLVLEDPSRVELDGTQIKGDSSKMSGAFYEMQVPVPRLTGQHEIVFTDINKKQYKETFDFSPITFKAAIPTEINRGDLVFELNGLKNIDYVRVLLTDTSFHSEGINRVDTVKNGRVLISRQDLELLVNGPIQLDLIRENEKEVKNGTREGGMISVTYSLKREFVLKD